MGEYMGLRRVRGVMRPSAFAARPAFAGRPAQARANRRKSIENWFVNCCALKAVFPLGPDLISEPLLTRAADRVGGGCGVALVEVALAEVALVESLVWSVVLRVKRRGVVGRRVVLRLLPRTLRVELFSPSEISSPEIRPA